MEMVFCKGCAKEISESAVFCPYCGYQEPVTKEDEAGLTSQSVTIFLCIFLGSFGIHRFYLSKPISGVLYLLFCWSSIPGFIAVIETYLYLFTSQESWARKYNGGRIGAPVHIALKILVSIFSLFLMLILLLVISMVYRNYTSGM